MGKWLGACLTCWGVCTACHAAIQDYGGLLTVRILCGLFESTIPSACMLVSAQYYTRSEVAVRYSYWYAGMGIAQILGGLISFGFQHVSQTSALNGWRAMFLALGLLTVIAGTSVIVFVPDTPMQARFLSDEEKINLLEHVKVNQTGIDGKVFHGGQLVEAILDAQLWCMFALITLVGYPRIAHGMLELILRRKLWAAESSRAILPRC